MNTFMAIIFAPALAALVIVFVKSLSDAVRGREW
jgi:hypothetical protein